MPRIISPVAVSVVSAIGQVDQLHQPVGLFAPEAGRAPLIEERHFEILEQGELWYEVEALKDEADVPAANIGEPVVVQAGYVHPAK